MLSVWTLVGLVTAVLGAAAKVGGGMLGAAVFGGAAKAAEDMIGGVGVVGDAVVGRELVSILTVV